MITNKPLLPVSVTTFEEIRSNNYIYVDKTAHAYNIVTKYKYTFLSRPRRFGKSLFLSTLKALFEGKKELFKGLWVYDKWNWNDTYPVINLSMPSAKHGKIDEFKNDLRDILELNYKDLQIESQPQDSPISAVMRNLIIGAYKKYNKRVVVLVDEYDKPVVDNLTETKTMNEFKNLLSDVYTELKSNSEYIRFVFLTGVSRFTGMSIFSGLNNLKDISLDREFGTIAGYSQTELETSFKDYLVDIDLEKLKQYYNGYNFRGTETVYNPFDVLLYLQNPEDGFQAHWYQTGTSTIFIKFLEREDYDTTNIRGIELGLGDLKGRGIENKIPLPVLMYQTGYLTIVSEREEFDEIIVTLDYPNLEVKKAFSKTLLEYFERKSSDKSYNLHTKIQKALLNDNIEQLIEILRSLFSAIPYHYSINTPLYRYEAYYATVILTVFNAVGLDVVPEAVTNLGRADLVLEFNNTYYVFEYKIIDKTENTAMSQIKDKKYYEKYIQKAKKVYLIGLEFSAKERNIVNIDVDTV